MTKNKLYRLMDVLEEIKQVDEILSVHKNKGPESSTLMIKQYKAKKEKLLVYFINEINSSPENLPDRLNIIHQIITKFYSDSQTGKSLNRMGDSSLNELVEAI